MLGLDAIEIVLRTEEVFAVELPDSECAKVNTVGDLYRLVLEKLKLPYLPSKSIENPDKQTPAGFNRARSQFPSLKPWNTQDVWITLKAIIQDQLQVHEDEIHENARFVRDLGCE
jgi:acyl carrier protein